MVVESVFSAIGIAAPVVRDNSETNVSRDDLLVPVLSLRDEDVRDLSIGKDECMNTPISSPEQEQTGNTAIRIGALVPLSRPAWVEAGQNLLCGLDLAVCEVNSTGAIFGRPLELLVRDTAADPQRAASTVDELAQLGVAALVGEYHSVVARFAAARANALGIPFLCSSAVLDSLTEEPTEWVARLAPAQSRSWQIYAEFLLRLGHIRIAAAVGPGVYWAAGVRILRDYLMPRGGAIIELDGHLLDPIVLCKALAENQVTALLLLVGHPDPAISFVKFLRDHQRFDEILIGAPAGQPEFAEWATLLGNDGAAIPFLRYMPERLSPLGARVETALRERLGRAPSFVAFEGYDAIIVLADMLRSDATDRVCTTRSWQRISVEGTRGQIRFSRVQGINVWQWVWAPIQVVDRNPGELTEFRVLYSR